MGAASNLNRAHCASTLFLACLCGYLYVRSRPLQTARLRRGSPFSERRLSMVLSADPGDMIGGFSEAAVLLGVVAELEAVDVAEYDLFCPTAHLGRLAGAEVLIVTTGIGATRAALCLDSLLRRYGSQTKEVLFLGTSGGSPAVGGVLDSSDCSAARPGDAEKLVRLGDICVSPFATNWDCQRCFWASEPYKAPQPGGALGAPPLASPERVRNACAAPPCSLHDRWDLFGDFGCSYFTEPSLADEVLAATRALPRTPRAPPELEVFEAAFWRTTAEARGAEGWGPAYEAARARDARAWGYDVCGEATSMTYWNGAPYDELARTYVAELMRETSEDPRFHAGNSTSKADVLAISAMEGSGWMSVLKLSETYLNFDHIPSANIRGVSDYTHDPVVRAGDDLWLEDATWVSATDRVNATRAGYRFSIRTTSTAVLALFDARRRAASSQGSTKK